MILQFTRAQIVAFAQSGLMNIKAATHWDVCNDLREGKDRETVAQKHHLTLEAVYKIRRCKCPDV